MASYIPVVNVRIIETVDPKIWYVYYRDHDWFTPHSEKSREKTHRWVSSYQEAVQQAGKWASFFKDHGRNVLLQDVFRA